MRNASKEVKFPVHLDFRCSLRAISSSKVVTFNILICLKQDSSMNNRKLKLLYAFESQKSI